MHWSRKRAVKRLWWWWFHALHGATNRVSTDKMVICFWATICKTVHHCLSVLSVALVYCGQTIGWIRMPLIMEVDLGPGHIVLDGDPASAKRGTAPPPLFGPLLWQDCPSQQLLSSCCITVSHYQHTCRLAWLWGICCGLCLQRSWVITVLMSIRLGTSRCFGSFRISPRTLNRPSPNITVTMCNYRTFGFRTLVIFHLV